MTIEWPPHFIGKESNKLEEVEEQNVPDAGDVYTEYPDPRRWASTVLPKLKSIPLRALMELSGMSRAQLQRIRAGSTPNRENVAKLTLIAKGQGK